MTENKRFVCYFDDILKKWCVQDTNSLDMHYVADESMGEEFAHLLNLYQQTLDRVEKENHQLKISSTMYHNLFKEFQRQMQGVKSIYDLDSKDFEDLIELSKGNVFDDEIGWVHLPIEELQE